MKRKFKLHGATTIEGVEANIQKLENEGWTLFELVPTLMAAGQLGLKCPPGVDPNSPIQFYAPLMYREINGDNVTNSSSCIGRPPGM